VRHLESGGTFVLKFGNCHTVEPVARLLFRGRVPMGEVQARSWTVAAAKFGGGTPNFLAS
jgi:hypothetical protein